MLLDEKCAKAADRWQVGVGRTSNDGPRAERGLSHVAQKVTPRSIVGFAPSLDKDEVRYCVPGIMYTNEQ